MASEQDIIGRESGGNPNIGYGGVDLSNAPRNKYGFPIWEGRMGPAGISHAAGLHQWEPATWAEAAQALGLTDFSEASQHKAYNYIHGKYGDAPWAASAPLRPGEHRWMGDVSGGGSSPLYLGTLEKNFHQPTGNDLLDALLNLNVPKEDKTGNPLLDQLMQQAMLGAGPSNQAQPADASKALGRIPQALPPETVPELSGQQVDIKPMQTLQPAAIAPPEPGKEVVPSDAKSNGFHTEATPPAPIPQPGAAQPPAFRQPSTGNGLLDRIFKQLSPISTAQAAETPPPAPSPTPIPASPPQQFIEPPAKGQQVPMPTPQTPVQTAAPRPRLQVPPGPMMGTEPGGLPSTANPSDIIQKLIDWRKAGGLAGSLGMQPIEQALANPTPIQNPADPKELARAALDPQGLETATLMAGINPESLGGRIEPPPMGWRQLPDGAWKHIASGAEVRPALKDDPSQGYAVDTVGPMGVLHATTLDAARAMAEKYAPVPGQRAAGPRPPQSPEADAIREAFNESLIPGHEFSQAPRPNENPYARPAGSGADFMQQFAASLRERRAAIVAAIESPTAKIEDSARLHEELAKVDHALQEVGTSADQLEDDQLEEIAKQYGYVPRQEAPSEPLAPKQPEISPPATPPGAPPPTGGEMPPATPIPPPPGIKEQTQALSDDLFKAAQSAEADRLEVQHIVNELPDDLKGAADEQAYHERESRMTGKPIKPSSTTQRIERLLKPMDDKIHADATWIREHAPEIYGQLQEKPLRTAAEGHVHRKIVGQKLPGEPLDPQRGELITGLGGGGLSRRASGMMHRTPDFMLEDNAGNRIPGKGPKVGEKGGPARYGETFINPGNGVKYTVKEPTTAELEAKYPNRRYVKSLLANTFDNYLRISRVRANIELLEKWKPELYDAGRWFPEASQDNRPANFVHVDVPQLRGWAEPHIAAELNDIFRTDRDDVAGMLQKTNKLLIGSMFALPVRHQLNVGAHYMVGRGADWLYRNPMLARAYQEVAHQGPEYLRYLRAGAGLRYASTLNENFYNTILGKLFHEQMTNPEWEGVFKELGHKAADVVKAEYAWSRRALWKVNDVFLTARIMELEKSGKPLKEAIRIAEEEIPNYRLPTSNLFIRKMIQSPFIAFGRYDSGRARAMAKTVENMIGPGKTGEERIRAISQALIMIGVGYYGYRAGNTALQEAQDKIRTALGPTWGPRIAGAKPMVIGGIGGFGPARAAAQYIARKFGLDADEKNWATLLGSWMTLAPAAEVPIGVINNRNTFTGQPIVNEAGTPAGQIGEGVGFVAGQLNPIQLMIESARKGLLPGIGPQFGVQQEYKGPPGKVNRMLRGQARRQEAHDPTAQLMKRILPKRPPTFGIPPEAFTQAEE